MEYVILGFQQFGEWLISPIEFFADLEAEQWFLNFWPLVFLDVPRYLVTDAVVFAWTLIKNNGADRGSRDPWKGQHSVPLVAVIISALNEERSLKASVHSVLAQDYPHLEVIVVDDGSNDRTALIGRQLAHHSQVKFFSLRSRQGKSGAVNFGGQMTKARYIAWLDSDSTLDHQAISEAMRPFFQQPGVGAVSGNIGLRNGSRNILTRLQKAEYLCSIGVGRQFSSRMGILSTVSGAFGIFRRDVLDRLGWFEPGTGEDTDMTIRVRKLGYRVAFAPEAVCLTNGPETWLGFVGQRLRWDRAIILFMLRKYRDVFHFSQHHFRLSNLMSFLDALLFQVVLPVGWTLYLLGLLVFSPDYCVPLVFGLYYLYTVFTLMDWFFAFSILDWKGRGYEFVMALPFVVPYRVLSGLVTLVSTFQELVFRLSYRDPYTPAKVRDQMPIY